MMKTILTLLGWTGKASGTGFIKIPPILNSLRVKWVSEYVPHPWLKKRGSKLTNFLGRNNMSKEERLQLIQNMCLRHQIFGVFTPQQSDIDDELARFNTRPDQKELDEECLSFMNEVFEGGQ